ncbi:MAG: 50S ribosomal protein L10 [Candidatus Gastranaerophilales bacterium]|nr:50S ribosomal protein L10 [Candidatus Gastranaerophilales bacterium]
MSTKAFKQEKIEAMKENFAKAKVAVVTEYRGLTVEEITKLRRALQKENSDYMVTKNTLAKVATQGTQYEVLAEVLKGPVAIAFGFADEVAPAKVLKKFIKETKKGQVIAAAMDGKLLNAKETEVLADLPSKEELYAKMLGCINSPATGIAGAVNAVMSGLVRAMDQVAKQKSA